MESIRIQDHINNGHRRYAVYDNERSIGHIADGMKTSHRKIMFTVLNTMKRGDVVKVAALGNRASDLTDYDHGDDSITEAVVTLARSYPGSNNLPLLQGHGQFGNAVDNDNSEVRYIHVSRHTNLSQLILEADEKVLQKQYSNSQEIEPVFYLPVLPLVLFNSSRGTGNGYASRVLPRDPQKVALAVKAIVAGAPVDPAWLMPYFPGFKGEIKTRDGNAAKFEVRGVIEEMPRTKTEFRITHLPPTSEFQYENYRDRVLLKLLDKKKIRSIENDSRENTWDIRVTAPREFTADADLVGTMGLVWRVTENLTLWGWDGKLHVYKDAEELLRDWVAGRLVHMETRRLSLIDTASRLIGWLTAKIKFLQLWNQHNAELIKKSRDEIRNWLATHMADIAEYDEAMFTRLLQLSVSSLKLDEIQELEAERNTVLTERARLRTTTPGAMLVEDIDAIKFYD